MNNKYFYLAILIIFIAFGFVLRTSSTKSSPNQSPEINYLNGTSHDWGEIDIYGGDVTHDFGIKNTGQGELIVSNFLTSCMCTEVSFIDSQGNESPRFGMHNSSSWRGSLSPGEEGTVRVVFDPLFHGPDALGPITRLITFDTNEGSVKENLRLKGNVLNLK